MKYRIKLIVGWLCWIIKPLRHKFIKNCFVVNKHSFAEESFWTVFHKYIYKNKSRDEREKLQDMSMGVRAGDWAEFYGDQGLNIPENPVLNLCEQLLTKQKNNAPVIQIGCASGKEIKYLAEKFPQLTFYGTDKYKPVIDMCQAKHKEQSNLFFSVESAHEISPPPQTLVFSIGSLQYVQPEDLKIFFELMQDKKIVLAEPVRIISNIISKKGSTYRGNFSWNHNYKWYAEKFGKMETRQCRLINSSNKTAAYFYYGTGR